MISIGYLNHERQIVRERIWRLLERDAAVPESDVYGRIPHFTGAARAADRLTTLPIWRHARTLAANPDRAQLPVRVHALSGGKTVFMRVSDPAASARPFYRLDPAQLREPPQLAAASRTVSTVGSRVAVGEMPQLDMFVCGSVAVNLDGVRVGRGAGRCESEYAMLRKAGLVGPGTLVVTTVHPLQVVDGKLPKAEHDFRVDVIVTSTEIITCTTGRHLGMLADHAA